ncbi:MAG: GGDEF domain-containing protein [Alphaproteobacteria bacterium]|nr:GGDEF domain-containing protein [Alphaproteobacteria bacterium]
MGDDKKLPEITADEVDAMVDSLYERGTRLRDAGDMEGAAHMLRTGMRMFRNDFNLRLQQRDLRKANAELEEFSETDALTGLLNLKGYRRAMKHELSEMRRFDGHVVGLAYIDLDGFKAINDTFGHQMGDKVLKEVARRLEETFRTTDIVCRLGGDEIAIILPYQDNNHFPDREVVANWIRDSLAGLSVWDEEAQEAYPIGASIGFASTNDAELRDLSEPDDLMKTLIEEADKRMFQDKWLDGTYTDEDRYDLKHPKNARLEALRVKAVLEKQGVGIEGPVDFDITPEGS